MNKRIVICADGTWNRPEVNPEEDFPTNVLRLARAIQPKGDDGKDQQVFYDWGIGSYYDKVGGGITGKGLHKNIMDNYRYIVQNYSPGDEIYLFGFSRGAYTVRCLCGMINNVGILKRPDAKLIEQAFNHYKMADKKYHPNGQYSIDLRAAHSHPSREVHFVGVFDTVGAMGIPITFLGLFEKKDEFYDNRIGNNVVHARHALAIDEVRVDFKPTVWSSDTAVDMKQVWFSGAHSDIGGSTTPDEDGKVLSNNSLKWMIQEASAIGLSIENHLENEATDSPLASINHSRKGFYRVRKTFVRPLDYKKLDVRIHNSVKARWDADPKYRPTNLKKYVESNGWPGQFD